MKYSQTIGACYVEQTYRSDKHELQVISKSYKTSERLKINLPDCEEYKFRDILTNKIQRLT